MQGRDLGHLRIIASFWEVDLSASDARLALQQLSASILTPERVRQIAAALPENAKAALVDLAQSGGRLSWAQFTRRYGLLRELGAGKRDREQPHLQPASPAEILWYRALVARSFFDTPSGPEEFAYIPGDLLELLPFAPEPPADPYGRLATQEERLHIIPATDRLLDHAATLLAGCRMGLPLDELNSAVAGWVPAPLALAPLPLSPASLQALLVSAGLLDASGAVAPEPVREFLEAGRGAALLQLFRAWVQDSGFNELRLIPYLRAEGEWENDPLRARQAVLGFLAAVPRRSWWSLPAFLADIHARQPDFQRTAGDYDSWFIRDLRTGEYLRGFGNWHLVDGLVVRAIITGPLHWLGLADLAAPAEDAPVSAFRLSRWSEDLLNGNAPQKLPEENGTVQPLSDGRVLVQRLSPRALRYQIARFCRWEGETADTYKYRLTPGSLERARQQGLKVAHLLTLLKRSAPPPSLIRALERWEARGVEARFERVLVLRVSTPDALAALRGSRAARFLGDPLGPTAVIVKPGAMEKVLAALAELGFLGDAPLASSAAQPHVPAPESPAPPESEPPAVEAGGS